MAGRYIEKAHAHRGWPARPMVINSAQY